MTTSAIKTARLGALLSVLLFPAILPVAAGAQEEALSVRVMPVRTIAVDGDDEKFREHHWMKDRTTGGIQDISTSHLFANGASLRAQGHALVDQNDLGSLVALDKEGFGFARFDYSEFRKYYDGTGGTYHYFTTLQSNETDRDLALDIGRVGMETGLTLEGWPELAFEYQRSFKDGAKSRLTWTAVKEGTTARSIGPSWQEIDEKVDRFAVKAGHEIAGFSLAAKQEWEFMRSELLREERSLSTTTAAADKKVRRQEQDPEADLMTTTLNAQRNFFNEKLFFSGAYRFAHMENQEFESIIESNAAGVATNFSNPKQIRDARADNDYNTHTWVSSLTATPLTWLTIATKFKAEVIRRQSDSSYPADASPNSTGGSTPNGIIDENVVSATQNKAVRFGEGFSLRYAGFPYTALYTEMELEQARVRLSEDRKDLLGANPNETFNRYTVTKVGRFHAAAGGQSSPRPFLNLTSQVSYRRNNNDYDDQRETDSTGTTARSAFFDGQRVDTVEWSTRAAFKPKPWLRPSLRYQLRNDKFATRVENEAIVKTGMLSHVITADLNWQPAQDLLATLSFSRQMAAVTTPARYAAAAGNTPTFNADVNTWLFSADYAATPKITLTGTLQYSQARNFNDFAASGLPLGADTEQVDLTAGLNWKIRKDSSIAARYGFYHYLTNSNAESGDYDAHVVWLEGTRKF